MGLAEVKLEEKVHSFVCNWIYVKGLRSTQIDNKKIYLQSDYDKQRRLQSKGTASATDKSH